MDSFWEVRGQNKASRAEGDPPHLHTVRPQHSPWPSIQQDFASEWRFPSAWDVARPTSGEARHAGWWTILVCHEACATYRASNPQRGHSVPSAQIVYMEPVGHCVL